MRNKNMLTTVIIVVVVLIAAGVLLAMRKSDNTKSISSSGTSSMDMSKQSASSGNNQSSTNANSVTIKDFAFNPGTITVKVGTKVTWTNEDSVGHTVTADATSSDAPASSTLAKGESYSFTFNKAGTYAYHCTPHPYMKGTVIVTE